MMFLFSLLLTIAISVVTYLLRPKPKKPKPPEVEDLEAPTNDSGRPIPVLFGTVTIKGLNVLWYGEKEHIQNELQLD